MLLQYPSVLQDLNSFWQGNMIRKHLHLQLQCLSKKKQMEIVIKKPSPQDAFLKWNPRQKWDFHGLCYTLKRSQDSASNVHHVIKDNFINSLS